MIRRGFVATPEGQLHFRVDGSGPPIVLLHQSPQSSRMYSRMISRLAPGRTVIAFDTLGYGLSDPPREEPSIALYARSVAAAIRALGHDRSPIFGYHTGSLTAIALAAHHPAVVSAIMLAGLPVYTAEERAEMLARFRKPPHNAIAVEPDGGHLAKLYATFVGWEQLPPAEATLFTVDRLQLGESAFGGFEAAFRYDAPPDIARVRCPVLVLTGTDDMTYPNTIAARAYLPDHEYAEQPGGKRFNDLEPFYADSVIRFMREHQI